MKDNKQYKYKVSNRIALTVFIAMFAVSISAFLISLYHYQANELERCSTVAEWASAKAALCLDGDLIDQQMTQGRTAPQYTETEEQLYKIVKKEPLLKYLYVYKVVESGCYVVFDLDMPAMEGREPGVRVDNDPDIYNRLDQFLAGGEVSTGDYNQEYGTLLSAYTPVYDSQEDCCICMCRYRS